MAYRDMFESSQTYYERIYQLVDAYRVRGCTFAVRDWEDRIAKVADYPDLRSLSKRAQTLYGWLLDREERES